MRFESRASVADFLGFLAYLFAVTGGRMDGDAVRGAAQFLRGQNSNEAPPPLPSPEDSAATPLLSGEGEAEYLPAPSFRLPVAVG